LYIDNRRNLKIKAFKCSKCSEISYSSADIGQQKNTRCPHCGIDMLKSDAKIPEPAMDIMRRIRSPDEDICVMCGSHVPEGRMVCTECEESINHHLDCRTHTDRNSGLD
jgi:DNA-directed RNA polymerase subunit RPC12/RpoP